jgi:mono/diheme cytochrome c family protein
MLGLAAVDGVMCRAINGICLSVIQQPATGLPVCVPNSQYRRVRERRMLPVDHAVPWSDTTGHRRMRVQNKVRSMKMLRWFGCFLICGLFTLSRASGEGSVDPADYLSGIKPILVKNCSKCHGPQKQLAGLRLDTAGGLREGGDSGATIVPGNSLKSLLIHAITGTENASKMPPEGGGLSIEEIQLIRKWIDDGAASPANELADEAIAKSSNHWSFQPVKKQLITSPISDPRAIRGPLDHFVVNRLESEGIAPSSEAARSTLLRRATLDILGISPTPSDLHEFLGDITPDAFERLIDRLLASPHFGERWGRDWLDAARYADSNGYTRDQPRAIWCYRDWVIAALNRNQPFNEFVIDQLAGDMLPNATIDQMIATGFHRNTLINEEGGSDHEQFRVEGIVDRVNTTGTVFLGLTMGCCQCHDHKYDPLSQREYFQFFSFFNNSAFAGGDQTSPRIDVPTLRQIAQGDLTRQQTLRGEIAKLEEELRTSAESVAADLTDWEKTLTEEDKTKMPFNVVNAVTLPVRDRSATHKRDLDEFFKTTPIARKKYPQLDEIARLRAAEPKFPSTMIMQELSQPRETFIHLRGDFLRKGAKVRAALPDVLGRIDRQGLDRGEPIQTTSDSSQPEPNGNEHHLTRLDLARWLVSKDNPLTSRVTVNRIWQKYFGRGLVETENDFGAQGSPPTHPELLDFLASEFAGTDNRATNWTTQDPFAMDGDSTHSQWDLKRFHRMVVTSATYRQSSIHRPELSGTDPLNRLLSRQTRLRLDAEVIRDTALSASGLLTMEMGGPPVFPPQPEGVFDFTQDKKPWVTATGSDRFKKAIYTQLWRSSLYPAMTVFDFPDATVSCTRRVRSNTPLQSLTLANDLTFVEFARGLAQRLLEVVTGDDTPRLVFAYELCLARQPTSSELIRLRRYLVEQRLYFARDSQSATDFAANSLANEANAPEVAAWTAVSRVLMNLDEFITRE